MNAPVVIAREHLRLADLAEPIFEALAAGKISYEMAKAYGSTADKARDKVPYIVDAMLRETHRESIALNGDPAAIDGDSLKKRLLVAAESIMGAGAFETISFRDTIQTDDPNVNPPPPEEHASAPAAADC